MMPDSIFRIYSMTKPIVSVAVMMLWEEGRLLLSDPISQYIPAFAETSVGVIEGGNVARTPALTPITVQDLLRHTSGLTYEFRGATAIHKAYGEARVAAAGNRDDGRGRVGRRPQRLIRRISERTELPVDLAGVERL